jgi:hypothetical protein
VPAEEERRTRSEEASSEKDFRDRDGGRRDRERGHEREKDYGVKNEKDGADLRGQPEEFLEARAHARRLAALFPNAVDTVRDDNEHADRDGDEEGRGLVGSDDGDDSR